MQYVNGLDVAQCIYNEAYSIYQNKTLHWEEIADIDECKVFSVDNPLYEGGLIFKCVGIVNCPPEVPWNILYKVENHMKWDQFCLKSKVLEVYDQLNFIDFVSYASPIGGVPRYFSLFRTCRIDYQNNLHSVLIRSIDHLEAEKEISNLDGVQSFVELKPSGWFIKEISSGVCQITFITNLSASSMDPYLPNQSRDDFKEIYRKSGVHCIYKIPNLKSYIYSLIAADNNQQQQPSSMPQVSTLATPKSIFKPLEILRECCNIIGSFESEKWIFFRKIHSMECYYKEKSEKFYRILYSDSFQLSSSLDIIETFILSKNAHLVDSWTYKIELVEYINSDTQIYNIKFRTIIDPTQELDHYVLKQVNHLPTGVLFIGFKSINYKTQTQDENQPFWYLPSGFFVSPLSNGQYLLRYIIQVDSDLSSYIKTETINYSTKKKILMSFSEKINHFSQSLKSIILQFNSKKRKSVYFPHWNTLRDKSFSELVDLFFKLAVSSNNSFQEENQQQELLENQQNDNYNNDNDDMNSCSSSPSNGSITPPSNEQQHDSKPDRKRKLIDYEKTSLVSVNPQFFYSNAQEKITIEPIPFTPNWENYIKRKPFLLLVSNKKSLEPPKKLIKTMIEKNSIVQLPGEILHYILTFLCAPELCQISLTCKLFYKITKNDFLWKELFESRWDSTTIFNFNININNNNNRNGNNNINSNNNNIIINNNGDVDGPWKKLYIGKDSIETNWKNGNPRISILKGHESKISALQFNQDTLLTASKDKELRIWNLGLKQCDVTVKSTCNSTLIAFEKDNHSKLSHEMFPYCLYNPEILRIGFQNGQIQNMNLSNQTITSSQRFVFLADGFIFDRNRVYIWENEILQLWDQNTGQKTHNTSTGGSKIKQFKVNSQGHRYLACADKTIKVWDLDSNTFSQQFHEGSGIVNEIDFISDTYMVTSSCKTISIWDTRNSKQPLHTQRSHSSKIQCLATSTSSKICSSDLNNILVWQTDSSLSKLELLSTIPTNHQYGVVDCLSMDDESLVLGYSKGTVSFLDFLT